MDIPLTSFVDFVLKTGRPRLTCAKEIKAQLEEPYNPISDYYKRFRDTVQELHKKGKPKGDLHRLIGPLPSSKLDNYTLMIKGYIKFLGSKKILWFTPPRIIWKHSDLDIIINPELGLEINKKKYVIKLYLKRDKPSKDRVSSILALMHEKIRSKDCEYGLLDVRNSKLYLFEEKMEELLPLIESEAVSLKYMLDGI